MDLVPNGTQSKIKTNKEICQSNYFTDKTPKNEEELLKSLGLGGDRKSDSNNFSLKKSREKVFTLK